MQWLEDQNKNLVGNHETRNPIPRKIYLLWKPKQQYLIYCGVSFYSKIGMYRTLERVRFFPPHAKNTYFVHEETNKVKWAVVE